VYCKSGDCVGHCRIFQDLFCKQALMEFEVCLGSFLGFFWTRFLKNLVAAIDSFPFLPHPGSVATVAYPVPFLWRVMIFLNFLDNTFALWQSKNLASSDISCVLAQAHLVQLMNPGLWTRVAWLGLDLDSESKSWDQSCNNHWL